MSLCRKSDYDSGDLFQSRRNNTDGYPILTTLGLLFQDMGDFKRATQCFQQHLNVSEVGDTILRSVCYHNLGNIALEYLHESMTIRLSLPSIEKSIMGSLDNDFGVVYGEKKDFKTAREYYEKALSYVLESVGENPNQCAMIYTNIGDSYRHLYEYDRPLMNFNKSLEILTIRKYWNDIFFF
jgi:tetratricopeptide (TPR) repeat protein